LKPSQGEINKKRIQGLIDDGVLDKVNIPLVVSGDNYVVDGHHRWAAYRLKKAEASLPVMVIDAPVKDVLGIAVAWGAKHQEF
jgi:ParB-like chromosome segregation protein Spo0J